MAEHAHFINIHEQSSIAGEACECREQLQVIVELALSTMERTPRSCRASVLVRYRAQPAQSRPDQPVIIGLETFDIACNHRREIKTADELLKRLELTVDFL